MACNGFHRAGIVSNWFCGACISYDKWRLRISIQESHRTVGNYGLYYIQITGSNHINVVILYYC